MPRDERCVAILEAADNSLQGYLGMHLYIKALHSGAIPSLEAQFGPRLDQRTVAVQITHEWQRTFSLKDFVSNISNNFEFGEGRILLLPMVAIFEKTLRRLHHYLYDIEKLGTKGAEYGK